MKRADGAYLYELGYKTRPIDDLKESNSELVQVYFKIHFAREAIREFLDDSVFKSSFRTIHGPAVQFYQEMETIAPAFDSVVDWNASISAWQIKNLKDKFKNFEAILKAELQSADLYHVSSKGGFETACLTDQGERLFPSDLSDKVPSAIADVQASSRCIAFELPTAAGFHLHRANEAVLRVYWDIVTDGAPRPEKGNMGVYLSRLNELNKGKPEVREHLKSIKDFHRNPLMHPEQSINSIDDAISLLAAIRCSVGYMLAEIPSNLPVVAV